jgi:hypothetical protein
MDVYTTSKTSLIWRVAQVLVEMDVGRSLLELMEIVVGDKAHR